MFIFGHHRTRNFKPAHFLHVRTGGHSNYIAYRALGLALAEEGDLRRAEGDLRTSVRIKPDDVATRGISERYCSVTGIAGVPSSNTRQR